MNIQRAAELLGPNLILPEALTSGLAADFSKEELEKLQEIVLTELELQALDPYKNKSELTLGSNVKNNFILFPIPKRMKVKSGVVSLNVYQLIQYFGYCYTESRKLFFLADVGNKREKTGEVFDGWQKWVLNKEAASNHPIYRETNSGWLLLRKQPIMVTRGENLEAGKKRLRNNDQLPTLLEVLIGIIAYYFSIIDPKKSDHAVGQPFFQNRDSHARLLESQMTWTSDIFKTKENSLGENLIVGYNLKNLGIDIYKQNPAEASNLVGLMPIRRLDLN